MRRFLRRLKYLLKTFTTSIVVTLFRALPSNLRANVEIGYSSLNIHDGIGAQLHRQVSLCQVSKLLGFQFKLFPITSVTIHPLDDHQSMEEYDNYLIRANQVLTRIFDQKIETLPIDPENLNGNLELRDLFQFLIRVLRNKKTLFLFTDAHGIIDFTFKKYSNLNLNYANTLPQSNDIAFHYRRGVGGLAIYPGQFISREFEPFRVKTILRDISERYPDRFIKVFTDGARDSFSYSIKNFQKDSWLNSPSFDESVGSLEMTGLNVENLLSELGIIGKVFYGGDPLYAFEIMVSSKILIISKSSLSYVAALLNPRAVVYFPKDFWHPKQKHWFTF